MFHAKPAEKLIILNKNEYRLVFQLRYIYPLPTQLRQRGLIRIHLSINIRLRRHPETCTQLSETCTDAF